MAATDDLTLRMRAVGARAAAREVDQTTGSVKRLGRGARSSSREAGLLGRSTGALLKPFRHLRSEAIGMAKGVAAAGLAFGSFEGVKRSIETTDSLVKTTVKLRTQFGLTTEAASGLAGVLQARDLQPQALTMGLVSLSKQLVAANSGTTKSEDAFRSLGISWDSVRHAVNSKDGLSSVFQTVVDHLSSMPGGARKAALSQQLLGRASRGLAPLLQEGALGLKQQLKWAKEFGVTLDDHTVGSVEDMVAAQTQAQYAMLGLQIQIGRFAAPAVAKANITLAEIVKSFRDGRPEGNKYARTVYQLGQDLKPLGRDLVAVGRYLKDHPRLLRAAAVAYVAYRLKILKLLTLAPRAYLKGLLAGRLYSVGFERGSTSGAALGRFRAVGGVIGRAVGLAAGAALIVYIAEKLKDKFGEKVVELLGAGNEAKLHEYKVHPPHSKRSVGSIQDYIDAHDTPAHKRSVLRFYKENPQFRRYGPGHMAPRAGTKALQDLIRAGAPNLIPGAFGVPSDFRPGHPYKGRIVDPAPKRGYNPRDRASDRRRDRDRRASHLRDLPTLTRRPPARERRPLVEPVDSRRRYAHPQRHQHTHVHAHAATSEQPVVHVHPELGDITLPITLMLPNGDVLARTTARAVRKKKSTR